jgi:protein SCO1/2
VRFAIRAAACLFVFPMLMAGCRQPAASPTATPAGDLKTFLVRGKIVTVDPAKGSVLLDHEAVPGFMEAMTMSYKLKNPTILSELHPGDRITAKLLVRKGTDGYEDPQLDEVVVIAQARPDYKPAVDYHVPTAGDAVPDFKLLNQNGKTIHLAQFKGRVLLLTFIYTRCPIADFCVRMSRNFAEVDKALALDPALYKQTHLLSISFDPKYDTPAVLKSYGGSYTGLYTKEKFEHWDFAVPPAAELDAITEFFNVADPLPLDRADRQGRQGSRVVPIERVDAGRGVGRSQESSRGVGRVRRSLEEAEFGLCWSLPAKSESEPKIQQS